MNTRLFLPAGVRPSPLFRSRRLVGSCPSSASLIVLLRGFKCSKTIYGILSDAYKETETLLLILKRC